MKCKGTIIIINLISIALVVFLFKSVSPFVYASSSQTVNASIELGICGDGIAKSGEDCDNADLRSRSCTGLGYSSGDLACDISCSFDTSSCVVPSISPTNISPADFVSLLPAGYLTIPPTANIISTPSLTTTDQLTINIPTSGGSNAIVLPDNLIITKSNNTNFDPIDFVATNVLPSSLSGLSSDQVAQGAVQFGIPDATLKFNIPITLKIYVGILLNGETLNIFRSTSLSTGWTNDGIVSPPSCTVSAGICTFQATKASFYISTRKIVTEATTSPSTTTTSTTTTTPTLVPTISSLSIIPNALRFFTDYLSSHDRIDINNLYNVVKFWVDDWKEVLTEQLAITDGETIRVTGRRCDVNLDNRCDIKDLSVLFYYVEK